MDALCLTNFVVFLNQSKKKWDFFYFSSVNSTNFAQFRDKFAKKIITKSCKERKKKNPCILMSHYGYHITPNLENDF
jgi:hypothetical protein